MQPGRRLLVAMVTLAASAGCSGIDPAPSTGMTTTPMQSEPSRASTTEPATTSTTTASIATAQSTTTTPEISPQAVALDLVARIRSAAGGDLTEAAAGWSGYPYRESEHLSRFTAWVDANPWLRDGTVRFEFTHNVNGREIYVQGTLDALLFLRERVAAGAQGRIFSMIDVLKGV